MSGIRCLYGLEKMPMKLRERNPGNQRKHTLKQIRQDVIRGPRWLL
uniref:Uncharacterized protein n=1 Tax=Anguilla anguilla TaxID=7936 RepID=A0A0E9VDU9_ANGAN